LKHIIESFDGFPTPEDVLKAITDFIAAVIIGSPLPVPCPSGEDPPPRHCTLTGWMDGWIWQPAAAETEAGYCLQLESRFFLLCLTQVNWSEPWIIGLGVFHLLTFLLIVTFRRNSTFQIITFFSLCKSNWVLWSVPSGLTSPPL